MAVDTTGINTKKIATMQKAIDDWSKAIEATKITATAKNITKAIKGSNQEKQVKALCQQCESYTQNLTSKLKAYKTRLDDVKAAYAKNDKSSTAISSVADEIQGMKS